MPAPLTTTLLLTAIALGIAGQPVVALVFLTAGFAFQIIVTIAEAFGGQPDDLEPL